MQTFEKVQFVTTILLYKYKMQICANGDVMHMHITFSVYRRVYVRRCVVFVYKVTCMVWLQNGMHNTVFLVVFMDLCLYTECLKAQRKNFSVFITSESCKRILIQVQTFTLKKLKLIHLIFLTYREYRDKK